MSAKNISSETQDVVQLSFFAELGKDIAASKTFHEVMDRVMDRIGETFAPLNWCLLLKDRKTGDLVFEQVVGPSADQLRGITLLKGEGIAGWVAETGQAVIVEDVEKDSRFSRRFDQMTGFETKSIIAVPLRTRDRSVIGAVELINRLDGRPFTALELKILSTIADFAAIALEKIYYETALRKIARIDALTGVYNRRSLEWILQRETHRARRYGLPLSMLLVDVDHFKMINDRLGHDGGDHVLKNLADLLVKTVRNVDIVARYGGDEFAVVMPHTGLEDAEIVRRRILQEIDRYNAESRGPSFTASVGLSSAGPDNLDSLFVGTDLDLYRQKEMKEEWNLDDVAGNLRDLLENEDLET